MGETKFTAKKKPPKGISIINHYRRSIMSLDLYEYVMMEAIEKLLEKQSSFDNKRDYESICRLTGFTLMEYVSTGKQLVKKGFLARSSEYVCTITDKWKHGMNEKEMQENFEKLWIDYGRVGNKQKAITMFKKCMKTETFSYIWERWLLYKEHIKTSGSYQKHLSSWLNPQFKEYENEWKISAHKKEETFKKLSSNDGR